MKKSKVLIIEDDEELAECFKIIIKNSAKYEVAGCFNNYEKDNPNLKKLYPDVILMDIQLPGMSGIEATRKIKKEFPMIKIIILSVHDDEDLILKAIKNGADGYLSKDASFTEILDGIEKTLQGGVVVTPNIAKKLFQFFQLNPESPLTNRETEVLQRFADGFSYRHIAEELFLSKETIKSHMRNIYSKMGVQSKNEAIELARGKKYIL